MSGSRRGTITPTRPGPAWAKRRMLPQQQRPTITRAPADKANHTHRQPVHPATFRSTSLRAGAGQQPPQALLTTQRHTHTHTSSRHTQGVLRPAAAHEIEPREAGAAHRPASSSRDHSRHWRRCGPNRFCLHGNPATRHRGKIVERARQSTGGTGQPDGRAYGSGLHCTCLQGCPRVCGGTTNTTCTIRPPAATGAQVPCTCASAHTAACMAQRTPPCPASTQSQGGQRHTQAARTVQRHANNATRHKHKHVLKHTATRSPQVDRCPAGIARPRHTSRAASDTPEARRAPRYPAAVDAHSTRACVRRQWQSY
jgi:hypothetical protein